MAYDIHISRILKSIITRKQREMSEYSAVLPLVVIALAKELSRHSAVDFQEQILIL